MLNIALIGDGRTDAALWNVVVWTLRDRYRESVGLRLAGFHDRSSSRTPLQSVLQEVRRRFDPDLVLFHRDAEGEEPEARRAEIPMDYGCVPLVPVRMTEAWLLIDAAAIAAAADNPNGHRRVQLPGPAMLESLRDPKMVLTEQLWQAADLQGERRRARFERDMNQRRMNVADYIKDYGPLRKLQAFQYFEADLFRWVDQWQATLAARAAAISQRSSARRGPDRSR